MKSRFGSALIEFSLNTTSKANAIKKRALEDLKSEAIFDALTEYAKAIYDPVHGVWSKSAPAISAVVEIVR